MLAAVFAAMTVSGANAGWGDLKGSGLLIDHEKMYGIEMAPASDGSTFIAWINWSEDGGIDKGFSLYAQLLDPQGNKMWGETGILVDGHPSPTWCSYWNILVTPEDELVISWADSRSEEGTDISGYYQAMDPVLYKIDKSGNMVWGEEGVTLDNQKYRYPAMLFQVGENIYARCTGKTESDPTQLMLLDEFGEPAWSSAKNFTGQIIASEGDDFLAVYSTTDGVMAMRYSKDMRQRWRSAALISEKQYGGYDLNPYTLRSDGHGGAAVCYLTPLGDFGHMPLVAYVTGEGETAFSEDVAATEDFDHLYPVMNINPETETIMTMWQMNAGPGGHSLQGAQMDYFGERMWGEIGKSLVNKQTDAFSYGPVAVEPLPGGEWLICYADEFAYEDYQLILARVDAEGNITKSANIGTRGSVNSPVVTLKGDIAEILWEENNDYTDDEGVSHSAKSIRGVRVDINDLPDYSGIADVAADAENTGVEYYSTAGIRLAGPTPGLNIVRKADGTVTKVIY